MKDSVLQEIAARVASQERIAAGYSEWLKTQKTIEGREWFKLSIREQMDYTTKNGGVCSPWRVGEGWKYVMEYKNFVVVLSNGGHQIGESSEPCILLAALLMAKKSGVDFMALYGKEMGALTEQELMRWKPLTRVPATPNRKVWMLILAALEDVNYNRLYRDLIEELGNKGIL